MGHVSAIREQIGRRIVHLRESQGLSQAEFARRTQQSRSTVHGWESGRAKPDDEGMLSVARILGTSVSFLYGETDDPRPAPDWAAESVPANLTEATIQEALADLNRAQAKLQELLDRRVRDEYHPLPNEGAAVFANDIHGQPYPSTGQSMRRAARKEGE